MLPLGAPAYPWLEEPLCNAPPPPPHRFGYGAFNLHARSAACHNGYTSRHRFVYPGRRALTREAEPRPSLEAPLSPFLHPDSYRRHVAPRPPIAPSGSPHNYGGYGYRPYWNSMPYAATAPTYPPYPGVYPSPAPLFPFAGFATTQLLSGSSTATAATTTTTTATTSTCANGAPGAYGTVPGAYGTVPGAYGTVPGAYGTVPGAYGTVPGAYGTLPGAYGTLPAPFASFCPAANPYASPYPFASSPFYPYGGVVPTPYAPQPPASAAAPTEDKKPAN